ncbi:MAG TPA: prepilin-type N-terminal cleavage/methylation domain-containing protein [Terriglobia bacterium]|nr:prepilin-type N-terminal cleavage/methylation domain-containing protein [Terriglobia bacterium]
MDHYIETGNDGRRGFTLVELAIVMIIIMVLASIAIPLYQASVLRSKETVLKANLYHMRDAIDQYTADKKYPPQTLEDLVNEGYFRVVPLDPITGQSTTWQARIDVSPVAANSSDTGIVDVSSGSIDLASDGTPYNTW